MFIHIIGTSKDVGTLWGFGLVVSLAGLFGLYWSLEDYIAALKLRFRYVHLPAGESGRTMVTRSFEREIRDYVLTPPGSEHYRIVIGPRACGKTTGVMLGLKDLPGLVKVSVNRDMTPKGFLKLVGQGIMSGLEKITEKRLAHIFYLASKICSTLTLVVELERGSSEEMIGYVAQFLKGMVVDWPRQYPGLNVHCILILSDASGIYALPSDRARQKLMWVPDFTEEEANTFIQNVKDDYVKNAPPDSKSVSKPSSRALGITDAQRNKFLKCVGTRPGDLRHFLAPSVSPTHPNVDEFVQKRLDQAGFGLLKFLSLKDIATKPFSSLTFIKDLVKDGSIPLTVDYHPRDVTKIFDDYYTAMYHLPTGTYRFHDTATRRVAEKLFGTAEQKKSVDDECGPFRLPAVSTGFDLTVASVTDGGDAEVAGIRAGDRLLEISQLSSGNLADVLELTSASNLKNGSKLAVKVIRGRRVISFEITSSGNLGLTFESQS